MFTGVHGKPCKNLLVLTEGVNFLFPSLLFGTEARGLRLYVYVVYSFAPGFVSSPDSSNVTVSWQLLWLLLFETPQACTVAELSVSLTLSRGSQCSDHNRHTKNILPACVGFVANNFSVFHLFFSNSCDFPLQSH